MALGSAAIIGGGSILSGLIGGGASKKAASTQADANTKAAELTYQMYQQTAERLKPWVDVGSAAGKQLGGFLGLPGYTYDTSAMGAMPGGTLGGMNLPAGTVPSAGFGTGAGVTPFPSWNPTMAGLEQTPGYQFTKQQGIQATTNALAGMGLGESGSLLKGVDAFTTGLASQTYGQQFDIYEKQFQNYWAQLSQIYNMLSDASKTGENAAAMTGQAGTSAAATGGNFLSAAGTNLASGTIGAASAATNALNMPMQLAMMRAVGQYMPGGGGGPDLATTAVSGGNY